MGETSYFVPNLWQFFLVPAPIINSTVPQFSFQPPFPLILKPLGCGRAAIVPIHEWSIANRKTYPRLPRELSILATETCNLHREKKDRGIGKWQIPYSRVYSKNMIPCYPRLSKVFPVCLFSVLNNILVPLKNKLSGYSVSWNPWVAFYISCCSPKLQNHLLFLNSLRKLHIKRK